MMHRNLKRFLACLCAVMLTFSCTGALAEFSSRLDALRQKDSVIVELTGKYTALNKLSKKSLETVNGWLSTLKATAQGQLGGLVTSVSVTSDGEEILSIVSQKQENGTVTEFKPSGNAYLTGDNQPSALSLLTGKETHLFDPLEIPQLYEKLAKALYPVLEGKTTAKPKKARTTVKNAAGSEFNAGRLSWMGSDLLIVNILQKHARSSKIERVFSCLFPTFVI